MLNGATDNTPAASAEETERILAWLEHPRTRLVRLDSGGHSTAGWASPARGAARWRGLLAQAEAAVETIGDFTR